MSTMRLLKNDAIVKIEIGSGFMQRLQRIFLHLAKDLTQEQLEAYRELAEKKEPFTEDWMEHITTLTVLLKEIESKAIEQGLTYEEPVSGDNDNIIG